jgi:hypothetical protein
MLAGWLAMRAHGAGDPGGQPVFRSESTSPEGYLDGPTIPHWGCQDDICQEIDECGYDNCEDCEQCDANQEAACIAAGWMWLPYPDCTCITPPCNPWDRDECIANWGNWDDIYCICSNPCNPGPPEIIETLPYYTGYCVNCLWIEAHHYEDVFYVQYCQDGRIWDSWSETIDLGWWYEFDREGFCWDWCLPT